MKKNYILLIAVMLTSFVAISQTAPPWNFTNTTENFVGSNFSNIAAGPTYATYTNGQPGGISGNPNLTNTDPMINTTLGNYIALTIQNNTENTRIQVIINRVAGGQTFTSYDGLSTMDTEFKTYFIDMSGNPAWAANNVSDITFRVKTSAAMNTTSQPGTIFFDKIEILGTLDVNEFINNTTAIYPNPVKDVLKINSSTNINKIAVTINATTVTAIG